MLQCSDAAADGTLFPPDGCPHALALVVGVRRRLSSKRLSVRLKARTMHNDLR